MKETTACLDGYAACDKAARKGLYGRGSYIEDLIGKSQLNGSQTRHNARRSYIPRIRNVFRIEMDYRRVRSFLEQPGYALLPTRRGTLYCQQDG